MSTPIPPEPTTPYPPLLPWLRRIGYSIGAMILLLLVVRLAWGWYAQHQLDATLADVQRRGYPTTEEQLVASVPPSADDAAPLLRRAVTAISHDPPDPRLPFSAADAADIDALCATSDHPLELLHQAAQLKAAHWDIRLNLKPPDYMFRDVRAVDHLKKLALLAHDAALLAHQGHQD